jgi:hypothetical protein
MKNHRLHRSELKDETNIRRLHRLHRLEPLTDETNIHRLRRLHRSELKDETNIRRLHRLHRLEPLTDGTNIHRLRRLHRSELKDETNIRRVRRLHRSELKDETNIHRLRRLHRLELKDETNIHRLRRLHRSELKDETNIHRLHRLHRSEPLTDEMENHRWELLGVVPSRGVRRLTQITSGLRYNKSNLKSELLPLLNSGNHKAHGGSTSPPPSSPSTREGDNALQSFTEKRTFLSSPLTGEGRVGVSPFNLFVPALCLSASVVAVPRRI